MSRRLRLLNLGMSLLAPSVERHAETPEAARPHLDRTARLAIRGPRGLTATACDLPGPVRTIRVTRIVSDPDFPGPVTLDLDGGGYVAGSVRTHRGMTGWGDLALARLAEPYRNGTPPAAPSSGAASA